ncbi:hypothetical protein JQN58_04915 [Aneurinibacillus sp. BA2021]|nr:hypothetical protein [Aneurinibacillus sp. BA2021]
MSCNSKKFRCLNPDCGLEIFGSEMNLIGTNCTKCDAPVSCVDEQNLITDEEMYIGIDSFPPYSRGWFLRLQRRIPGLRYIDVEEHHFYNDAPLLLHVVGTGSACNQAIAILQKSVPRGVNVEISKSIIAEDRYFARIRKRDELNKTIDALEVLGKPYEIKTIKPSLHSEYEKIWVVLELDDHVCQEGTLIKGSSSGYESGKK